LTQTVRIRFFAGRLALVSAMATTSSHRISIL
jgi:hypothetical protein